MEIPICYCILPPFAHLDWGPINKSAFDLDGLNLYINGIRDVTYTS